MADGMLTYEDFEPHTGSEFVVMDGAMPGLPLALQSVKAQPRLRASEQFRIPFTLVFQSSTPQIIEQGLYRLGHVAMGDLDIFLVPMERNATGIAYHVSFN